MSCHGLPSANKKRQLEEDQLDLLLSASARKGIYNFASPIHPKSIVAQDLIDYYGDGDVQRGRKSLLGALSTTEGRCKAASDCLHLRRKGSLHIRISISRETDRFTDLPNGALKTQRAIASRSSRLLELRALFLNCYFIYNT